MANGKSIELMRWLVFVLILLSSAVNAADVTATTGWANQNDSNDLSGSPTHDAGSNRVWVLMVAHNDQDLSADDEDSITVTVGSNTVAHTEEFCEVSTADRDKIFCAVLWNEAAVATFASTIWNYSDTLSNFDQAYVFGMLEGVDQAALPTDFSGSDYDTDDNLAVAATGDAGDYRLCMWQDTDAGAAVTGWDLLAEIFESDSPDSSTFAAGGGNADDDSVNIISDGNGAQQGAACLVFTQAAASAGEYDTDPDVDSQTATAYTISGSLDAAGDSYAVACLKDQTAPTAAQIAAGDCTGDADAEDKDSDSPSMGSFDVAHTLTPGTCPEGTVACPIYDLYFTDDTSVVTRADEALDVPSGYNRATLTSVDGTSPFDGTDVATGDICTIDSLTSPDGYATTIEVDGTVSYVAGGDQSRQIIGAECYDVSGEEILDYTLVFNNASPEACESWELESALYDLGAAWMLNTSTGAISVGGVGSDVESSGCITDEESDTITYSLQSGTLPDGTCGQFTFTIRGTDPYGAYADLSSSVNIGNQIPDVSDVAEATAVTNIEAVCSFMAIDGGDSCSGTVAAGNVTITIPSAGTLVEHDTEVTYSVSNGIVCGGDGRGLSQGLKLEL